MEAAAEGRVISAAPRVTVHPLTSADTAEEDMKATSEDAGSDSGSQHPPPKPNQVGTVMLYGIPIVSLVIDTLERLCLAQISNTLLRDFSYNEIHNRRVALGITCVQCTPVQLEILRRAGAMPVSSRRCGMITRREAERLCRSFLGDNTPPRLPDHFAFDVAHSCAWGCRGAFLPSRYNSSRAKCIRCSFCRSFFSPNKFIFHSHRLPDSEYVQPDAANFNSWRRHLSLAGNPAEEVVYAWEDVKAMFNGGTRKRMLSAAASSAHSNSGEGSQGSRRTEQRQAKVAHHAPSSQDARPHPPPPPPPGAHLQSYLRPDKPRAEFPLTRAQNPGPPGTELAPFVHLSPLPPPPPFPESALHPPPPPSIHYDLHRSFVDYVWSRQHCGQGGRGKTEAGFAPFSPYSLPWFKRPLLPFPPQNAPEAPHSPIVLPPPPPGALTERTPQDSRATPPSPALPHHHPGPLPAPFHPRSPAPASVISNLYASAFRPVGGASRRESEERREEEMREEEKREEDEEEETVDIETTEEEEQGWRGGGAGGREREGGEGAEGGDGEEEEEEGGRSGEEGGGGEQKSKENKAGERCRLPLEDSPSKSTPPALHPRPPPPLHRQWVPREADQQTERALQGKAALPVPHPMEHDRVYCHEMARQLHIIRELGVGTTAPSDHCHSPFFSEPLLAPASSIPVAEGNRRVVRLVTVHDRLKDAHSTLHQLSNKMALDCSTGCHLYPEAKLTQ